VTEQQLARMAKRRLAILRHAEEITGNVSLTCRYYGISRQCFYIWKRRYDAHGLDGLRDRSHRPQVSPNATRTEAIGKIITCASTITSARPGSPCSGGTLPGPSSDLAICPKPSVSATAATPPPPTALQASRTRVRNQRRTTTTVRRL
jgi:transposase-like protein